MQAAIITGPRCLEITDVPDPTPGPSEVVIEVAASGICGTDVEIFEGEYRASLPVIPGHEFSGTVVAVGRDVRGLRVGDRVAADPNLPCLRCRYCHDGRVNLCDNYAAFGVTMHGAAAQYRFGTRSTSASFCPTPSISSTLRSSNPCRVRCTRGIWSARKPARVPRSMVRARWV